MRNSRQYSWWGQLINGVMEKIIAEIQQISVPVYGAFIGL